MKTRQQIKRDRLVLFYTVLSMGVAVSLCILAALCIAEASDLVQVEPIQETHTEDGVYLAAAVEPIVEVLEQPIEDPLESYHIAQAVEASIGTPEETQTFGYNATYVMEVLTGEAGSDYEQCLAVSQALFNACTEWGGKFSPEEMCKEYKYTKPAGFITDQARQAFLKVFVYGEMYDGIGDSTIFYNPSICGYSSYHESQIYVATIHGVKYFQETRFAG